MNKKQIVQKQSIKEFYNSLSDVSPRANFRDSVIAITGCTPKTFWNWVNLKTKPPLVVQKIISEVSGINVDELFIQKNK